MRLAALTYLASSLAKKSTELATSSTVNSRPQRKFNELHMPMSQLFEKLKLEGHLGPLEPRPPPSPLPKSYKSHEF